MATNPPDAVDLGVELLPADDDVIAPEDALAAAAAQAADDPTTVVADDSPQPFGKSWVFDWSRVPPGFVRQGFAPAETRELGALRQWCLMAVNTARYAHAVFSDEFGMERPDDIIGEVAVAELVSDYEQRMREALLVHDRITSVENFAAEWDPVEGVLTITSFDVVTDEDETVSLAGVQLQTRGVE